MTDYDKPKDEYGKSGETKYYVEKSEPEEEKKELLTFQQIFGDIPKSGSIASNADYHNGIVYFSALDSYIYAVNAETGELIWKFKTGAPTMSTPLVHRNYVYFGSNDGYFYCTDLNGRLVWKKYTGDIIVSSPLGISDMIVISTGSGYVFCFSPEGEELWKFKTGEGITANPAAVNDTIFVGSYDRNFYAINTDGTLKWRFTAGERVTSPLIMTEGKLLCDPNRRSWDRSPESPDITIYCPSYDNNVYAFREDGAMIWRFNCGTSPAGGLGGSNGTVYAGTISGLFFAIDAVNGIEKWRFKTGGMIASGAEVKDGNVYFTSFDQKLYCFSEKGEKLWDFLTGGPTTSRPLIVGNKIFFGSADTFFYCLDITKRSIEWTFQVGFGMTETVAAYAQKINNAFIEYDRKIFRVWVPETIGKKPSQINAADYTAKLGLDSSFTYGGTGSYLSRGGKKKDIYGRN